MNPQIPPDEPSAEFRSYLEWQIQSAMRREARFSEPFTSRLPRMRTALAVLLALAIGGAGGLATGYAQESRDRDQLLESARTEESLVKLRLDLARAERDQAKRRVDAGTAERQLLIAAEDQVRAVEAALARVQLNMDEIRATAAAPRDDLQAPLVARRDFVTERLMIDLATTQRTLSVAEQEDARAQERWKVGLAQRTEVQQADTDLLRVRLRMQMLAETLALRRRAVQGEVKPEEIASALRKLELTQMVQSLRQELELSQTRLDEAKRRFAAGTAAELDVKAIELRILEQQVELRQYQQALQGLGARK
jgi:hypothetical protein